MSLSLTDVNAFTQQYLVPRTTHLIAKSSPVLVRLESKSQMFRGGLYIQRPVQHALLPVKVLTRGGGFNLDEVKTSTAITGSIKVYGVNISLFAMDGILNSGPEAAFSIVEEKMHAASLSLSQELATDLYLNSSAAGRTDRITGLDQWIDDGNGYASVGGVTRTDILAAGVVGGLNSYVADVTSFTLRDLNTGYTNAIWANEHVDIIATNINGYNKIWEAAQPLQCYEASNGDLAKLGFTTFRFNATDVVMDRNCPTGSAGRIFGINTSYVELYRSSNPLFDYGFTGFKVASNNLDYAGQFCVGMELMYPSPRSSFKLKSSTSEF